MKIIPFEGKPGLDVLEVVLGLSLELVCFPGKRVHGDLVVVFQLACQFVGFRLQFTDRGLVQFECLLSLGFEVRFEFFMPASFALLHQRDGWRQVFLGARYAGFSRILGFGDDAFAFLLCMLHVFKRIVFIDCQTLEILPGPSPAHDCVGGPFPEHGPLPPRCRMDSIKFLERCHDLIGIDLLRHVRNLFGIAVA